MTTPSPTFLGAPAPGDVQPFVMPELWRIGADGVVHRLTADGWVDDERPLPPGLHPWRREDADSVLGALIGSRTVAPWCYPDAEPRPPRGGTAAPRPAVAQAAAPAPRPARRAEEPSGTVPGERWMWRIFWVAMLVTVVVLVVAQCSGRR